MRLPKPVIEGFKRAFHDGDAVGLRAMLEEHDAARSLIDEPLFPFDSPALVCIAGSGDLAMVDVLLDFGADPNRRSGWWAGGFHALHSASGVVADRLIAAGAEVDACGAANLDRLDLLRAILHDDPSRVNERGGDGQTPLHFARSREAVDLLLEHGADVDARDVDHRSTPAQWMLERRRGAGRYDLAAYLVERGATTDVFLATAIGLTERIDPSLSLLCTGRGEYGEKPPSSFHIYTWTIGQYKYPLQVAAQFDQEGAFDALWSHASPTDRLLGACLSGRDEVARGLLRERPGLIRELRSEQPRALPDAAWDGNSTAVALMMDLGFDATATGQDGGTALHCGAWQGDAECVEALLKYPSAARLIETHDRVHNSTPLGWCCHGARFASKKGGNYREVARLLLEAGAKPGPNLGDAPPDILAVIQSHGS